MKKVADYLTKYYLDQNFTCAETVFAAANEAWELNLPEEARKMMGGFGGGMSYGSVCGAISGGVAALSAKYNGKNGHESPIMRTICREFMERVDKEMGNLNCKVLREQSASKDKSFRCLPTIEKIVAILDEIYEKYNK